MKTVTKSSTIPPLRVNEDVRAAAEATLVEGETLSKFVLRESIQYSAPGDATGVCYARVGGAGRGASIWKICFCGCCLGGFGEDACARTQGHRLQVSYTVRFTPAAAKDLQRLFDFMAQQDIRAARKARAAITKGIEFLGTFPFSCRKASVEHPFLRELIISFGANG
jgi:ParE toxin of type II toxin-antitoxin system, parDE